MWRNDRGPVPSGWRLPLGSLIAAIGIFAVSPAAWAITPALHYPEITLGGESTAPYTATATFPGGNPTAAISSDKSLTRGTGASVFLPADRGFGVVYGSSKDFPYLSIDGNGTTTTITFSEELPAGEIGIALGDIDAEKLVMTMTQANSQVLTAAEIGSQTPFNYSTASGPIPTVTLGTNEVEIADAGCVEPVPQNTQCDTNGATAWFEPTVGVATITITSTTKVGIPRYQLWLGFTASQKVTWEPETTLLLGDLPQVPSQPATSSGAGAITYQVDNSSTSDCVVNSQTAEISATTLGTCLVTASAAATADDLAGSTTVTFTITTPPAPAPPEPTKSSSQTAVSEPQPAVSDTPGPHLAATGNETVFLWWGLVSVGLGIALIALTRPQHQPTRSGNPL